jgi:hypothetical protein
MFESVPELQPVFDLLKQHPSQLELYPNESYAETVRSVDDHPADAVVVGNMEHMAQAVYSMAVERVKEMKEQLVHRAEPLEAPPGMAQAQASQSLDAPPGMAEAQQAIQQQNTSGMDQEVDQAVQSAPETPVAVETEATMETADDDETPSLTEGEVRKMKVGYDSDMSYISSHLDL